ncbi:glycosyltransferase [Sutcliffiella deserti]|uniref:glycosyltransferase n=1 Tax=Sutcliffiella deserti TaxID=2875501 RepID=UPI001CBE72A3|nr:glycosyltransferase [Sutcliffiella deserti]
MIKITYIVSTLKRSGPVNQLFNIIKNLDETKFKAEVITLSPEPEETFINKYLANNIKIHQLKLSRNESYKAASKIKEILKKNNTDIVQTQGIRADVISAYSLKKYLRITTIRNYPHYDYKMTYGKVLGTVMANVQMKVLKEIDVPVACSKSVAEYLLGKGLKLTAVQNGVNTEEFRPVDKTMKSQLKEKLGLPLDKRIFISVGHLSSRKDPELIMNAFIESKIAKNAILLFVGDGPLRSNCDRLAEEHQNIKVIGRVSNVDDYLQASDWFVSASKAEGLPNSVLEAMAVGLPTCLSDISPHKEILAYDDQAGFLFETGNAHKLTEKFNLIEEMNIEDDQYQNAALAIIHNHLSSEVMSRNYQKIYLEEMNKRK